MSSGSDQASSFPPWLQSAGKETPVQPQAEGRNTSTWSEEGAARTGPQAQSVDLSDSKAADSWPAREPVEKAVRNPQTERVEPQASSKSSEGDITQTGVPTSQFVRVPVKSSVLREGFQPAPALDSTPQPQQQKQSLSAASVSDASTSDGRSNATRNQVQSGVSNQADGNMHQHIFRPSVTELPHAAVVSAQPTGQPAQTGSSQARIPVHTAQRAAQNERPTQQSPTATTPAQATPPVVDSLENSPKAEVEPQRQGEENKRYNTPSAPWVDPQPSVDPSPAVSTQLPPSAEPPAVQTAPVTQAAAPAAQARPQQTTQSQDVRQQPQAGQKAPMSARDNSHGGQQPQPAQGPQPADKPAQPVPQAVYSQKSTPQVQPAQSVTPAAQSEQPAQSVSQPAPQTTQPVQPAAAASPQPATPAVAATPPPAAEPPLAQAAPRPEPQPASKPEENGNQDIGITSLSPPSNLLTDGKYPTASNTEVVPWSEADIPNTALQGNPFDPSDDPNQYLAPPAGLDQSILIDPVKRAPKSGWRKIIHSITAGYINLGDSEKVDRHQKLIEQTRAPLRGDYKVAVLSLKGGVGKTTTSVMLGGIFASLRGDRVIAIDANPDFGNLAQRAAVPRSPTIRDLLNASDIEKYSDVRTYTTQAESNLEVIGSDRDPEISEAFSEDDYRHAIDILQHYYNIILTDCGTGLMHSAMKGVLDLANTLILVTSPALDGAQSASATLDWLSHQGYGQFVANAIVVVSSLPSGSPSVDVKQLVEHFQSRTRAVQVIPYDKHLSEGAVIDLERLDRKTYMAYLELASLVAQDFASWHRHAR